MDEVFVCSNPKCDAVWAADPCGHCPKCITPSGVGFSTIRRRLLDTASFNAGRAIGRGLVEKAS